MAVLAVMVAQAAMPALQDFLLEISRQVGPAVGELLRDAVRRRSLGAVPTSSDLDPLSAPERKRRPLGN
jgi:hypothetical protein